ncbi:response regulator transcription factor [soil metagenome]
MSEPGRAEKILVVEDDANIRLGLAEVLGGEGYVVETCERGDAVAGAVAGFGPDLVVLDVMLPGMDGFAVCRKLREAGVGVPVLMLTAKGQEFDKVIGLESGADDYVTKPFGVRELVARVRALLRRTGGGRAAASEGFLVGDAKVFPRSFEVERDGRRESLTPKELGVILLLRRRRGEVLTRDALLDQVWGMQYFGTTRTVDQTVAQLRKKLGDAGSEPKHLLTVHGAGYRLVD